MQYGKDIFFLLTMPELCKATRDAGYSISYIATHGKRSDLVDFLLGAPRQLQEQMKLLMKEKLMTCLYRKRKCISRKEVQISEMNGKDAKKVRETMNVFKICRVKEESSKISVNTFVVSRLSLYSHHGSNTMLRDNVPQRKCKYLRETLCLCCVCTRNTYGRIGGHCIREN